MPRAETLHPLLSCDLPRGSPEPGGRALTIPLLPGDQGQIFVPIHFCLFMLMLYTFLFLLNKKSFKSLKIHS